MQHSTDFSPLYLETLQPLISTNWMGRPVYLFDQLESTNTSAKQFAEKGASHGTVVVADFQSRGKGRMGREWFSPPNMNLYFSVILTRPLSQSILSWIPLATGIGLGETIEEMADLNVSLKWPNDLFLSMKKLGGILCESTSIEPNGRAVIVGVGININCQEGHFPQELKQLATSLAVEAGHPFDRHVLLARLFSKLESYYDRVWDCDLSTLHSRYRSRCSTLGRHIQVRLVDSQYIEGIATSIGDEGELNIMPSSPSISPIDKKPSTITIRAGDVIHLR